MHLLPILAAVTLAASALATSFVTTQLTYENGTAYSITRPTAVALSPTNPDLLLVADFAGFIHLLRIRQATPTTYVVLTEEDVISVGKDRSVLALSVDPFDPTAFFASTSIVLWKTRSLLPASGWQNGQIDVIRLSRRSASLALESALVTGLPVSNRRSAQGVFGVAVDSFDASLYISLGTFTGGGVNTPANGGVPDCVASSSIAKVDIRTAWKTRKLTWSSDQSDSATITTPSRRSGIEIFATGIRSALQPVFTADGSLIVFDNGVDPRDELRSTSCTTEVPVTTGESDKVINVTRGAFYGHANRARGRSDADQCVFVTDEKIRDGSASKLNSFAPPLFTTAKAMEEKLFFGGLSGVSQYVHDWSPADKLRGTLIVVASDDVVDMPIPAGRTPGILSFDIESKSVKLVAEGGGSGIGIDVVGSVFVAKTISGVVEIAIPVVDEAAKKERKVRGVWPPSGQPGSRLFVVGTNLPIYQKVFVDGVECTDTRRVRWYRIANVVSCRVPRLPRFERGAVDVKIGHLKIRKAFTVLAPNLQ